MRGSKGRREASASGEQAVAMSGAKKRTRLVSFRATRSEYDALLAASVAAGADSISEYVRFVACSKGLDTKTVQRSACFQINRIHEKLEDIASALQRLGKSE